MLEILAPVLMLAQAADCSSEATQDGRYRIRLGEKSCEQQAKEAAPPRDMTAAEQKRIIAHFDDILVDGPSARWRWGKVVRGSIACLSVNAKNRMGGYSGWVRYTFDLETGKELNLDELDALMDRLGMERPVDQCAR